MGNPLQSGFVVLIDADSPLIGARDLFHSEGALPCFPGADIGNNNLGGHIFLDICMRIIVNSTFIKDEEYMILRDTFNAIAKVPAFKVAAGHAGKLKRFPSKLKRN